MRYSLLESKKLKGEIGELIVAHLLRRKGFFLYRPWKLLEKIEKLKLPESYEVEFLRENYRTMDYFAIFPERDSVSSREVVHELFSGCGLRRYFEKAPHQGFVVEVKAGSSELSSRQRRMIEKAVRLGFRAIVARVNFEEDY